MAAWTTPVTSTNGVKLHHDELLTGAMGEGLLKESHHVSDNICEDSSVVSRSLP